MCKLRQELRVVSGPLCLTWVSMGGSDACVSVAHTCCCVIMYPVWSSAASDVTPLRSQIKEYTVTLTVLYTLSLVIMLAFLRMS